MAYTVGVAVCLAAFYFTPAAWPIAQWVTVFFIGFFLYGPQMLIGLCGAELVRSGPLLIAALPPSGHAPQGQKRKPPETLKTLNPEGHAAQCGAVDTGGGALLRLLWLPAERRWALTRWAPARASWAGSPTWALQTPASPCPLSSRTTAGRWAVPAADLA